MRDYYMKITKELPTTGKFIAIFEGNDDVYAQEAWYSDTKLVTNSFRDIYSADYYVSPGEPEQKVNTTTDNQELSNRYNRAIGNAPIIDLNMHWDSLDTQIKLIQEETKEIVTAYENKNVQELLDGIGDTIEVVLGLAGLLGINGLEVHKKIYESNMLKLIHTDSEYYSTVLKYVEEFKEPTLQNKTTLIPLTEDSPYPAMLKIIEDIHTPNKIIPKGKALKCINWKEPDLSKFLKQIANTGN